MSNENAGNVSYESTLDLDGAKQVLKDLLSSLEQGKIVIQHNGEHVVLEPQQGVKIKLKGEQKDDKQSLEIKMSWRRETQAEQGPPLSISSREPEPEPEAQLADAGADSTSG